MEYEFMSHLRLVLYYDILQVNLTKNKWKENPKFKLASILLKIDLVSYPDYDSRVG